MNRGKKREKCFLFPMQEMGTKTLKHILNIVLVYIQVNSKAMEKYM
jgi:hypothetical protein